MKKDARFPNQTILMILFAGFIFVQTPSVAYAQSLNYINSSVGLLNPQWGLFHSEVEFADVNSDGHQDIISIGDDSSPEWGIHGIMVYFGDGAGNWTLAMNGDFGYGGIAAGDVNNDGFMDVGYGMSNNNSSSDFGDETFEVALGDGTGLNWIPWDDGLGIVGAGAKMVATDFADVDNDGDLDIGSIARNGSNGIHIFLNKSDGTWEQSFQCLSSGYPYIFRFGDLNNDGIMDFITDSDLGTAYFGDGTGGFSLNDQGLPSLDSTKRAGISLGDVNNDGSMDLAFINFLDYYGSGPLKIYVYDTMQQKWIDFSGNLPDTYPDIFDLSELSDMNMDGFTDLVAINEFGSDGNISVFLGDGNGLWQEATSLTLYDIAVAHDLVANRDVDHNGYPDIMMLKTRRVSSPNPYYNLLEFYRESSEPGVLSIKPVFPKGQELIYQNSIRNIEWVSAVPEGEISHVRLQYSVNGPDGPWNLIADNLPDNGCYQWRVPNENSANCYIQYTVNQNAGESQCLTPVAFSITNGTLGIPEGDHNDVEFHLSPNPASCQLKILSTKPSASFDLVDLYGRTLMKFTDVSSFPYQIDISGLKDGMYIILMTSDDTRSGSVKFVKVSQ